YRNPNAEAAVALALEPLLAAGADNGSYTLTILNSPAINAFALPGGFIYVTRGLIALANDSSELAAVIAHEMAHVTAAHALARQDRLASVAIVDRVADVLGDDAAVEAAETARLTFAQFSQAQELEADAIGIATLAAAGLDPFAAARFLTSMGRFSA